MTSWQSRVIIILSFPFLSSAFFTFFYFHFTLSPKTVLSSFFKAFPVSFLTGTLYIISQLFSFCKLFFHFFQLFLVFLHQNKTSSLKSKAEHSKCSAFATYFRCRSYHFLGKLICACAAANLAIGTRNGEQET